MPAGNPRGRPKIPGSGRQKGTPNKRLNFSVHDRLKELGIDLVGQILEEIERIESPEPKARALFQLLEYCDAKRKAIELTHDVSFLSGLTKSEIIENAQQAIKVLAGEIDSGCPTTTK